MILLDTEKLIVIKSSRKAKMQFGKPEMLIGCKATLLELTRGDSLVGIFRKKKNMDSSEKL